MSHLFLSYSRRDAGYVDRLTADLHAAGYDTWVDRQGIAGGEQWRREIVNAIQSASLFVLFLSPNSARSDNVRKEIDLAEAARVKLLPVAIAPADIPPALQYQLAGVQIVEVWRDHDRASDAILAALRNQGVPRIDSGTAQRRRPEAKPQSHDGINLADLGGSRFIDMLDVRRFFSRK
jgi:TIR domain